MDANKGQDDECDNGNMLNAACEYILVELVPIRALHKCNKGTNYATDHNIKESMHPTVQAAQDYGTDVEVYKTLKKDVHSRGKG